MSYWNYYYDTQWSQFLNFAEFDEPYENFYLQGDKVLDNETGEIRGKEDNNPDAEMGENSGFIVEDDIEQDLGDVDIEHNGTDGGSIIVDGEGCVNADGLHFRINVTGGRWYFFCFPFDVRSEDIVLENGADWVFRYYDGAERAKNGKGGWKNVTSDGDGNHLKAATGYIFQCSKNDVLILTAKDKKIKKEKKYNELVEHITGNVHDASWNFVGNPYLSYYEVSSDDYSAPLTVWDGSKYIAIRPGDDDYQLAPFEAFFVQKPEGVYTLSAPRMDTPMLLRDNATGVIHDFAEGSYEFASGAGTFDDRFTVMMKAGETAIDEQRVVGNESPVYNIKGQRVNEATEQGVYIKGDRKVVKM